MRQKAFAIPRKAGAQDLSLCFAQRRGQLHVASAQPTEYSVTHFGSTRLDLHWPEPLQADPIRIVLAFDSEEPILVSHHWGQQAGDAHAATPVLAQPSKREVCAERDLRAQGPLASYQRFFNALDRETGNEDPSLWKFEGIEDQDRLESMLGLSEIFMRGLSERRRNNNGCYDYRVVTATEPRLVGWAQLLSSIFLHSFECGGLDTPTQRQDAFLLFASGALSMIREDEPQGTAALLYFLPQACQPDTAYFFYFAELADLCLQLEVAKELWAPLLPALVYSQKVFWDNYQSSGQWRLSLSEPVAKAIYYQPKRSLAEERPLFNTMLQQALPMWWRFHLNSYLV